MNQENDSVEKLNIENPTLLLNVKRAKANIRKMADKAARSRVIFRPHFKTHQSAEIGHWFREAGVDRITVSSMDMAWYFAESDWSDIIVAFSVNPREIARINHLTSRTRLGLLVESVETVQLLSKGLERPVDVWIKIDVGYRRTGLLWDEPGEVAALAGEITKCSVLNLRGLLTHDGRTYKAGSKKRVLELHREGVGRMKCLKEQLLSAGFANVLVSVGDTPSGHAADEFRDVDEVRPGNFVFNDLMQLELGVCAEEDIAVGLACPIVAKHRAREEMVIHGGAVHLSKDFLLGTDGQPVFGRIARFTGNGWGKLVDETYVSAVSQEHGIVRAQPDFMDQIRIGDLLVVLPVHSCLTANLMPQYLTLSGEVIPMMGTAYS